MAELYSTNDSFKNLVAGERVFGLRGYIQDVHFQQLRQHTMVKFILTNGDARVVCVMFDELTERYLPILLENRIVEIDAGLVRAVYMPRGGAPFNINIDMATVLNCFGFRPLAD